MRLSSAMTCSALKATVIAFRPTHALCSLVAGIMLNFVAATFRHGLSRGALLRGIMCLFFLFWHGQIFDLLEARVVGSRARTLAVFLAKMILILCCFLMLQLLCLSCVSLARSSLSPA